jgi:hypothetical protein
MKVLVSPAVAGSDIIAKPEYKSAVAPVLICPAPVNVVPTIKLYCSPLAAAVNSGRVTTIPAALEKIKVVPDCAAVTAYVAVVIVTTFALAVKVPVRVVLPVTARVPPTEAFSEYVELVVTFPTESLVMSEKPEVERTVPLNVVLAM